MLVTRLLLFFAPFVAFYVWRQIALRTGRAMGSTPWAWLVGAGALLVALSLLLIPLLEPPHKGEVYIPAEATADGFIPGRYEKRP